MFSVLYYILFSVPLPVIFTIFGTLILTVFMYIQNLVKNEYQPPKLYHTNSTLAQHVLRRVKRLTMPLKPPLWARNAHVQTILPSFLSKVEFHFEREFLLMKDRGVVALDWGVTGTSKLHKRSPVLIVVPGLTGDATSVTFLCRRAVSKGFRPVVFNKRGHGGTPLTTPKLQSFGDPADFRQVVKYVRSMFCPTRIVGVACSAGSGLLMAYLGEYGHSSYISAAVCISPAYDGNALFGQRNSIAQPYEFWLLYGLKKLLCKHGIALSKVIDIPMALKANTIRDFDRFVYCKLSNLSSLSDYWEKNEPMRDIDDVATPVLYINSADDPVYIPKKVIPFDLFRLYPNFMLAYTERGGHCGFLEGPKLESWAEKVAVDYVLAVLEFLEKHDR